MADVFISYKSERRSAARHLAETLTRHGFSVWYDYQLVKGRNFGRQIDAEIRASRALVVLWCSRSVGSEWVHEEVDLAKSLGILVPVKIEACELPVGNRLKDYVNLVSWDGSPRSHALDPLLDAIGKLVGREPGPQFAALRDYEAAWRSFGALPLSRLGVETPLEHSEGVRHLPSADASEPKPSLRVVTATGNVFTSPTVTVNQALLRDRSFEVVVGDGKTDRTVRLAPGETAPKDSAFAPEMVLVPPGKYKQGDETKPVDGVNRREVTIGYPLLVGKYPVMFDEWDAAHILYDVGRFPDDGGWGRGRQPVINVSWNDAQAYVAGLSKTTGKTYRLLTEAEWEYACRAGTETAFSFGDTISTDQANYNGNYTYGSGAKGEYRQRTIDVGSFPANDFGLYDMHGNVWEWCEDCYADSYKSAPTDGSKAPETSGCSRVVRGGSWNRRPGNLRSADRYRFEPVDRLLIQGFRVARSVR